MATLSRPGSALSDASTASENQDMWQSMLSSVASSKRLPQKTLLVLGGTPDNQKEFIRSLSPANKKPPKTTPLANAFALGYTYLDILDADHEDVLARMGVYLTSTPTPAFVPLLRPLFTPQSLPETLVVILLDWNRPWDWMRELKTWIRLLRGIFTELDDDSRRALDDVMNAWEARRSAGVEATGAGGAGAGVPEVTIPLGPGEFDEPIGLPLCVVCQNADKIETLERERGYKEEEFDFILQFLRTILLKHGASLIYTTPSHPTPLPHLLHNMLGLSPLLHSPQIKHNIIDRDKILVPAFWDSWGKIRVLREGFDVEGITTGWTLDIADSTPPADPADSSNPTKKSENTPGGAVDVYEEVIIDRTRRDSDALLKTTKTLEVPPVDTQAFLAAQAAFLESQTELEKSGKSEGAKKEEKKLQEEGAKKIAQHVGPVQFNVGGIQVDAENMLERLKEREASRADGGGGGGLGSGDVGMGGTGAGGGPGGSGAAGNGGGAVGPDGKSQEDVLSAFFTSLMKKEKGGGKSSRS